MSWKTNRETRTVYRITSVPSWTDALARRRAHIQMNRPKTEKFNRREMEKYFDERLAGFSPQIRNQIRYKIFVRYVAPSTPDEESIPLGSSSDADGEGHQVILINQWRTVAAVSYTHLTLPTICSV